MPGSPPAKYDFYISYSTADDNGWVERFRNAVVEAVSKRLGRAATIFGGNALSGSDVWEDQLLVAVEQSRLLILLLSHSYTRSDRCARELQRFTDGGNNLVRPIFPVVIRPVDPLQLPKFAGDLQHIVFYDKKGETFAPGTPDWEAGIEEIGKSIAPLIQSYEPWPAEDFSSASAFSSGDHGPYPSSSFASSSAPSMAKPSPSSAFRTPEAPPSPASFSETPIASPAGSAVDPNPPLPENPPPSSSAASPTSGASPSSVASPSSAAPSSPQPERVSAQSDSPAIVDALGRRPFAEVLAGRIDEVRAGASQSKADCNGFMIHIDGPWGSGKSSVLNFLRTALQDPQRPAQDRWVGVLFNAWQQQRIRPPWWSFIREVYVQSRVQLDWLGKLRLTLRWWWWRIRADLFPLVAAALVVLICVLVATGQIPLTWLIRSVQAGKAAADASVGSSLDSGIKIVSAVLAVGATVFTLSKTIVFGSARAAQTYVELHSDPLRPIERLFTALVATLRRPLLVLIDDLDRCEGKYVVELLEGIQTLFRRSAVTYVVAADRRWICSSFEKEFEDFKSDICDPGRPLGYLFLEKMFQVSVSIPRLSPEWQKAFWRELLRNGEGADLNSLEAKRQTAERAAVEEVKGIHTQEGLQQKIEQAGSDPVREQAVRAAAAKQISQPEARQQTEHRLQQWADLMEHNPRTMKRTVNAVAMRQAIHFLEGRQVSPDALAVWTMLEIRWPILAYYLAGNPSSIRYFEDGATIADGDVPAGIRGLFTDAITRAVANARCSSGSKALTEADLAKIVA